MELELLKTRIALGAHQVEQELTFIAGECKRIWPCWKTVWMASYKTKHTLTIWSNYHTPQYLLKVVGNSYPHKSLHMDVYSNFIHIFPHVEATNMFFSKYMKNKPWCIYTMEYYSVLKRNELSNQEGTWRKLQCILISNSSQSGSATFYVISSGWHPGKGK